MFRLRVEILVLMLSLAAILSACSKDANPAVPGAPVGDVTSVVERNPQIRVGLVSFTPQKHLYVSIAHGSFKCYVGDSIQEFASGIAGDVLEFTGGKDTIEYGQGAPGEAAKKLVRVEPAEGLENNYMMVGPSRSTLRPYRGKVRLILEGKNLLAVNELALEDYLLGVVPAEMNPEWPKEALRAQAVVSRTYALFNLKRYDGRGFDVADDERSQKYGGVSVETEAASNAVIDTTNEIVTYEGKLAVVVFHAESGGQTASNLDVWPRSGEVPYLKGVSDAVGITDFSKGGLYDEWSSKATFDELKEALNLEGDTYAGSYLSSLTVLGKSENGRVQTMDILGEKNPVVPAMTFIQALNRRLGEDFIPSNKFKITIEDKSYRFTGSGKGHGVGMSQWGAFQRAQNDQGFEFVIQQYFPGCEVGELPLDGIEVVHNTRIDMIR